MRIWETSEQFPFRTLRSLGVVVLIHGIILIILGVFDVVWTVVKYTDAYDECPYESWPDSLEDPCDNDELVWTWVAEGVWGGFLVLLVGVLGALFSRMRVRNLRFQRDMFGVGCILLGFPICPAIIVCSVLELYYDDEIFYHMIDNELETEDIAKFVVPLLVAIFAFLAWVVAIAAAVVACCAKVDVTETLIYNKTQPRPMVMAQQPQQPMIVQAPQPQQPVIIQAPTPIVQEPISQPAFEVVPIPQPAPPPYYVMGPHPAAMGPPPFGPMGPHMGPMGPPPFGPPMGPPFRRPPLPAIMPPEPYM